MNSQLFLYLNMVVGLGFVIWFLGGRDGARSRFGGGGRSRSSKTAPPPPSQPSPPPSKAKPNYDAGREERERRVSSAKSLNILFMYNGHDWDAYQVLGVPAGAGLEAVTKHYQDLIKETTDKAKLEFYEAAFAAILKKF